MRKEELDCFQIVSRFEAGKKLIQVGHEITVINFIKNIK